MKNKKSEAVWLGLVEVTGPPDIPELSGCPGAYVVILAMASDNISYLNQIRKDVESLGLKVVEVAWCLPIKDRTQQYDVEEYLLELAKEVELTSETRFGIFHAWESEK